jgi:hypothetical protein
MHFDGSLANGEVAGNLASPLAFEHEQKYIVLSLRKGAKHTHIGMSFAWRAGRANFQMLKTPLDRFKQLFSANWFKQEVEGTGLHRINGLAYFRFT